MATEKVSPCDEREVAAIVQETLAANATLAVVGVGTKRALGRHAPCTREISLVEISGVTLYEPEELVLSARAGTPLAEIESLLDAHQQQLAFEPMDYAPLFGGAPGAATLGGAIAVNASGPRRVKAGAARDHLLGFRCVTGRGEIVKSGGRVMKNVTGFDLSKLICGSYGTLAIVTEATFKVLPKAECEETLLLTGIDESAALAALRRASGSSCEASSLAALPPFAAPLSQPHCVAAMRLEGPQVSVERRRDDLRAALAEFGGAFELLAGDASRALWRALRDAAPVASGEGHVWRVSVAPTQGYAALDAVRTQLPLRAHFFDWAGGLLWLNLAARDDAHAAPLRAIVDSLGGHATLIRADAETRAQADVFHPQSAPLAALAGRVKDSFDPAHVLERGRMRAEY
jgi:glycolate oxidase FAD binding subunit